MNKLQTNWNIYSEVYLWTYAMNYSYSHTGTYRKVHASFEDTDAFAMYNCGEEL